MQMHILFNKSQQIKVTKTHSQDADGVQQLYNI